MQNSWWDDATQRRDELRKYLDEKLVLSYVLPFRVHKSYYYIQVVVPPKFWAKVIRPQLEYYAHSWNTVLVCKRRQVMLRTAHYHAWFVIDFDQIEEAWFEI